MGDVWAMTYPTTIALQTVDHTFIEALDAEGNPYHWKCFGFKNDGDELAETRTNTAADITTVGFMASELPCKWPAEYYLRIGVCHQCANRALYYTGQTVSLSRGYNFFAVFYGTYGDEEEESYQEYSMQECLASAPEWQGGLLGIESSTIAPVINSQASAFAEIALYDTYQMARQNGRAFSGKTYGFKDYLNDLFRMKINANLGDDFPERVTDTLLSVRNTYRDKKKALDRSTENLQPTNGTVLDKYATLLNELAETYKRYLTPAEYASLFNLNYFEPLGLDPSAFETKRAGSR